MNKDKITLNVSFMKLFIILLVPIFLIIFIWYFESLMIRPLLNFIFVLMFSIFLALVGTLFAYITNLYSLSERSIHFYYFFKYLNKECFYEDFTSFEEKYFVLKLKFKNKTLLIYKFYFNKKNIYFFRDEFLKRVNKN